MTFFNICIVALIVVLAAEFGFELRSFLARRHHDHLIQNKPRAALG